MFLLDNCKALKVQVSASMELSLADHTVLRPALGAVQSSGVLMYCSVAPSAVFRHCCDRLQTNLGCLNDILTHNPCSTSPVAAPQQQDFVTAPILNIWEGHDMGSAQPQVSALAFCAPPVQYFVFSQGILNAFGTLQCAQWSYVVLRVRWLVIIIGR